MESVYDKMKKLARWRKKKFSAPITDTDPVLKVIYLGNVLTGWAKGEGCLEKPLSTLWKNYSQNNRSDVVMRLAVCSSGLQATTSEHGLTEYWSHRVTWCAAPPSYPRIFAWIYRHEGRRLKQELRCHAVLCSTSRQAKQVAARLEQRLREALYDFRREKLCRQSARLSVAACLYDDFSYAIPRRKLLLAPGINNYRPPAERSKSAPKLGSIEEAPELEEVEERDWLRVLALQKPRTSLCLTVPACALLQPVLETVNEELASSYTDLSLQSESDVASVFSNSLKVFPQTQVILSSSGDLNCESPVQNICHRSLVHIEEFVPVFHESKADQIFEEIDMRLRLDSAVEFLESDSFTESPCSSTENSPFLGDKGRLSIEINQLSEDTDNVSDESGYSEEKELTLSRSDDLVVPLLETVPRYVMNEEFTLNL